jgi:hypothetical protein
MSQGQFSKLDAETQAAIIERVNFRKRRFLQWTREGRVPAAKILLVGDCPANDAPDDPQFHFTPFGALRNSSLFVNLELHYAGIDECNLAWCNSSDFRKVPTTYDLLSPDWPHIIALGGAAEKWVLKGGRSCVRIDHPAYHKRFHSRSPYALASFLRGLLPS